MKYSKFIFERAFTARNAEIAKKKNSSALVGFEFEFAIPPDTVFYYGNENRDIIELRRLSSLDDASNYFDISRRQKNDFDDEFSGWKERKIEDWANENYDRFLEDGDDDTEDERRQNAIKVAKDEAESFIGDKLSESEFVEDEFGSWKNFFDSYNIEPLYGWAEQYGNRHADRSAVYTVEDETDDKESRLALAKGLEKFLKVPVDVSTEGYKNWKVEADGSVEGGHSAEIISPPMPWSEAEDAVSKIEEFASYNSLETNSSTGLHINISVPNIKNIDAVKFIVFLDDDFSSSVFDRQNNTYAKSQTAEISKAFFDHIESGGSFKDTDFNELQKIARLAIRDNSKYRSVNLSKLLHSGYIEIRLVGGDYLSKTRQVLRFLNRVIICLDLAMDEKAERNTYIKKLFKLMSKSNVRSSINTNALSLEDLIRKTSIDSNVVLAFQKMNAKDNLEPSEAFSLASTLIMGLTDSISKAQLSRLSIAQAGQLLKLLKKHNVALSRLVDAGLRPSLRELGLAK